MIFFPKTRSSTRCLPVRTTYSLTAYPAYPTYPAYPPHRLVTSPLYFAASEGLFQDS